MGRLATKLASCYARALNTPGLFLDVAVLLTVALAIRVALFTGFALGDDLSYAQLADQVLRNGYPEIGDKSVFLTRPVLILALCCSLALFGWSEVSFVLPILLASLTTLLSVYLILRILGTRIGAWIGAISLMFFPLDVAHSTTLTNDILGSGFVAVGALLICVGYRVRKYTVSRLVAFTGGLLLGLAVAVKVNFLILIIPLTITTVIWVIAMRRSDGRSILPVVGWVVAQVFISLFFLWTTEDPWTHVRVEFNPTFTI